MRNAKEINWGPVTFLVSYQTITLLTVPFYLYYGSPSWSMAFATLVLLYLTGLSITAGYHRYFSHRTFKTNNFIEAILIFFGSMSAQGSVLRWSYEHRIHHAYVDTDEDPYCIQKGFWYAHCTWLLEKPREIEKKIVPDLMRNKMVMLQHRYYGLSMVLTNFIAFLFIGWLLNDYAGAFFLSLLTRLFFLHHCTWFINSLAHTWGDKPYCKEQTAVNNYVISLLTWGEGYHNYHHTYANDYRNGIKWYHFDPTKWLIWTLSKLGLATNLKRMDYYTINKRMVTESKRLLMDQIKDLWYVKKDELEVKVSALSDSMVAKIKKFNQLKTKYRQFKKECGEKASILQMKQEIKELKQSIKEDWRQWRKLSATIMHLRPISA